MKRINLLLQRPERKKYRKLHRWETLYGQIYGPKVVPSNFALEPWSLALGGYFTRHGQRSGSTRSASRLLRQLYQGLRGLRGEHRWVLQLTEGTTQSHQRPEFLYSHLKQRFPNKNLERQRRWIKRLRRRALIVEFRRRRQEWRQQRRDRRRARLAARAGKKIPLRRRLSADPYRGTLNLSSVLQLPRLALLRHPQLQLWWETPRPLLTATRYLRLRHRQGRRSHRLPRARRPLAQSRRFRKTPETRIISETPRKENPLRPRRLALPQGSRGRDWLPLLKTLQRQRTPRVLAWSPRHRRRWSYWRRALTRWGIHRPLPASQRRRLRRWALWLLRFNRYGLSRYPGAPASSGASGGTFPKGSGMQSSRPPAPAGLNRPLLEQREKRLRLERLQRWPARLLKRAAAAARRAGQAAAPIDPKRISLALLRQLLLAVVYHHRVARRLRHLRNQRPRHLFRAQVALARHQRQRLERTLGLLRHRVSHNASHRHRCHQQARVAAAAARMVGKLLQQAVKAAHRQRSRETDSPTTQSRLDNCVRRLQSLSLQASDAAANAFRRANQGSSQPLLPERVNQLVEHLQQHLWRRLDQEAPSRVTGGERSGLGRPKVSPRRRVGFPTPRALRKPADPKASRIPQGAGDPKSKVRRRQPQPWRGRRLVPHRPAFNPQQWRRLATGRWRTLQSQRPYGLNFYWEKPRSSQLGRWRRRYATKLEQRRSRREARNRLPGGVLQGLRSPRSPRGPQYPSLGGRSLRPGPLRQRLRRRHRPRRLLLQRRLAFHPQVHYRIRELHLQDLELMEEQAREGLETVDPGQRYLLVTRRYGAVGYATLLRDCFSLLTPQLRLMSQVVGHKSARRTIYHARSGVALEVRVRALFGWLRDLVNKNEDYNLLRRNTARKPNSKRVRDKPERSRRSTQSFYPRLATELRRLMGADDPLLEQLALFDARSIGLRVPRRHYRWEN